MGAGAPSKYTEEIANEICDRISTSNRGLAFICRDLGVAPSSVFKWLREHKEFSESYARAREAQADFLAEEMLEIADHNDADTVVVYGADGKPKEVEDKEWTNRSRLRVDTRKWIASKLRPKKYGDKIDVTTDDQPINKVTVEVVSSSIPLADKESDVNLE